MTDDAAAERKRRQRERERQLRGDVDLTDPYPRPTWDDPTPEGWRLQVACRNMDPDIFFPTRGADLAPALAVCRGCPVREPCLEYALAAPNLGDCGCGGGTSERQRRRIRSQRARARRLAS